MTAPRSESPNGMPANLAKGCVLCYQGAKMVLFVTGRCRRACWYCPLSEERKGNDVIFANEHRIETPEQAVEIAERMSALGTGVTGGEPLLCLDRVAQYCKALKDHFGPEHQIHLYTAQAPAKADLEKLKGIVDEIRLHPPHETWPAILDTTYDMNRFVFCLTYGIGPASLILFPITISAPGLAISSRNTGILETSC